MAAPVEDASLFTNYPDWELLPALNEIQADGLSLESKIVQIEQFYPHMNAKMPCYDDSTCALAPSLVEFVKDDSSVDSLSTTGNITYLSTIEAYQTEVEIIHPNNFQAFVKR